jgi:hypothetical protein
MPIYRLDPEHRHKKGREAFLECVDTVTKDQGLKFDHWAVAVGDRNRSYFNFHNDESNPNSIIGLATYLLDYIKQYIYAGTLWANGEDVYVDE